MKKLSYLLSITAMAALVTFSACKKDEEEAPAKTCADEVYPTTSGTATVNFFKNFTTGTGTVNAGDIVAIAVEVTRGDNRAKFMRIYQSDCDKSLGTIVNFDGQAKVTSGGEIINLANTDEVQVRTINYTVPSGISPIYLNIEVEEGSNRVTYKQLVLTVTGSGIVDTKSDIEIGAQSKVGVGSRMSSALGYVYNVCDIPSNLDQIDVVYAVSLNGTNKSYLCSNPARSTDATLNADNGTSVFGGLLYSASYSATCMDENGGTSGTYSTGGGKITYFKLHTGSVVFDNATDSDLSGLTVSSASPQYVEITSTSSNNVFEFLNAAGKKGLIRVDGGSLNLTNNSIMVDVKVQR